MTTRMTKAFATLLLATAAAPPAANPLVGTWRLDAARSTLVPAELASKTIAVATDGPLTTIVETVRLQSGETHRYTIRYTEDGRFTPEDASPLYDAVAVRRLSPRKTAWTIQLKGQPVGDATQEVAADGRTMLMLAHIQVPGSGMVAQTSVFERATAGTPD